MEQKQTVGDGLLTKFKLPHPVKEVLSFKINGKQARQNRVLPHIAATSARGIIPNVEMTVQWTDATGSPMTLTTKVGWTKMPPMPMKAETFFYKCQDTYVNNVLPEYLHSHLFKNLTYNKTVMGDEEYAIPLVVSAVNDHVITLLPKNKDDKAYILSTGKRSPVDLKFLIGETIELVLTGSDDRVNVRHPKYEVNGHCFWRIDNNPNLIQLKVLKVYNSGM